MYLSYLVKVMTQRGMWWSHKHGREIKFPFISIIRLKRMTWQGLLAMITDCRPCRDGFLAPWFYNWSQLEYMCGTWHAQTCDCFIVLPLSHNVQWPRMSYTGFKVMAALFLECVNCRPCAAILNICTLANHNIAIRDHIALASGCFHHAWALTMTYLSHRSQKP